MKDISNLAKIVTSRRQAAPALLNLDDEQLNKETQLVFALVKDPNVTQRQVVKQLYDSTSEVSMAAFRKLRSRVQSKLLNHLLFLDHSDERHLVSRRYELECLDLLHKVSVLFAEGEYVLTERLLQKCLRLAAAGEFTAHQVWAMSLLRTLYAEQRKSRFYRQVAKKLTQLQQLQIWEQEAAHIYSDTQLALVGTVAARRAILAKVPALLARLEALHKQAATFTTYHYLYRFQIAQYELQGQFQEIIRLTSQASRQLEKGKINARRFDRRFNHFMSVYGHLWAREAVRGLRLAEAYAADFHPSSSNWFYFYEHYLLLALHAGEYAKAREVLNRARSNPRFSTQRDAAVQRWDLYGAYVDLVQPTGKASAVRPRQLAQWALTLPDYNRDKRGHNVAILILQTLYFLRQRDLEAVLLRMERLRKYQQRHLQGNNTLRSRLFLRLLLLIVEKNFNPIRSAERGEKVLEQLRETPFPGEAFAEIEIIPYEDLWALTLELLKAGPPLLPPAEKMA